LNTSAIRSAIANKDVIEFTYQGYPRVAEPHVYGILRGKRHILVYQTGGLTSSGSVPDWRLVDINDISGLKVTGTKFAGPRENKPDHGEWDAIIVSVK
jgi:hypothetical protein